jgi:hypothetical protein
MNQELLKERCKLLAEEVYRRKVAYEEVLENHARVFAQLKETGYDVQHYTDNQRRS